MSRPTPPHPEPGDVPLVRLLEELNRLEDLLEDMDANGVKTRTELVQRIASLHASLDVMDDG